MSGEQSSLANKGGVGRGAGGWENSGVDNPPVHRLLVIPCCGSSMRSLQ